MIPIRDHNPTFRRAVVVPIFLAANVLIFLFVQPTFVGTGTPQGELAHLEFFACNASIAYEVMNGESVAKGVREGDIDGERERATALIQTGSERFGLEGCPRKNVWLSILASMFFHGGWLHIIGNMLFLWVFGNNVEDRLGRLRFVAFYVISGVVATYAQALVAPDSVVPMVGASGAIAGILGAYLVMFPRARVTTLIIFFFITSIELPAIVVLGLWFVMQLFQGVGDTAAGAGGVAYMAHVGGFVAGMVLLLLFRPKRPPVPELTTRRWPYEDDD